ncbi:MAG: TonB-dependent receptor [Opitutaceae bacterium]|nr:TonB-dependent receptor [Opitutaceae bacterium]
MQPIVLLRALPRLVVAALACVALAAPPVSAQSPATGVLTGRVQDRVAGLALENARVTIEGTSREAFTDAFGEYRFADLPAGPVTLRVFYTGRAPQTATVSVTPGGVSRQDFELPAFDAAAESALAPGVVKLDQFVVESARMTNAAAIAINEQRFAANAKTVVSTDALGIVGENNIGEFVKFLPGVEVVTDQMNAVAIQLRGMPQVYTGISIDGETMNVAATGGPSRATSLQTISLANATRIEVYKVPTPDMPASSLGGSINLVSRTAFEKSRPEFQFRTFLNKNSHYPRYAKAWGNDGDSTSKNFFWGPGFDLTYTVPISKNFGFSINAVKFEQFNAVEQIRRTFSTTTLATNPVRATVDNPYFLSGNYLFFPITERRYNLGLRLDWRLSPTDKISFIHSGAYFKQDIPAFTFNINTGTNPVSWGPDFTHGRPGSGRIFAANNARHFSVRNHLFRLNYSHLGARWDFAANLSYGFSAKWFRELSYDQLANASGEITGATIDVDDNSGYVPGRITVRNAAGSVVDPFDLRNYNLFVNGSIQTRDSEADARSARLDATRKFFDEGFKFSVKTGLSVKEEYAAYRMGQFFPAYVGPDGRAASGDEGITRSPIDLTNYTMQEIAFPRGLPTPTFPSTRRAFELFQQYPQYFDTNVNRRADLLADMTTPFDITERIDAAYAMGDLSLINNRLRIVAGMRFEQTTDDGRGVLQDNSAQYQRNPATSALILNAQRRPIHVIAPEKTVRTTLTPAELIAQDALVYTRLGSRMQKQYHGYYPSLNASYNVTENLIGRLGLARTIGRPEFTNLVGASNVTQIDFEPDSNTSGSALGTIVTKNPALKPWTADSLDLRLEYYTRSGGDISVGFFRKQIKNFFANRAFLATADFLESINLSTDYVDYRVTAPYNTDAIVHVNGWEMGFNQPLAGLTTIEIARYFRTFANATFIRPMGPGEADFRGFSRKNINAGFMFNRRPVSFVGKWYLIGKKRLGPTAAAPFGIPGWNYQMEKIRFDASLDYQLTKRFSLYITGRNIFNDRDQQEAYAVGSPRYVRESFEGEYGVTYQFGVKGTF